MDLINGIRTTEKKYPYFITYSKIYPKWIKDLNLKMKL